MNITKLNFSQAMPQIIKTIKQSHLVSLDLEMSGIISPNHPENNPSLTDSIQIRYHKTKQRIHQFIPLQLGLCLIKAEHGKVIYNPLNFYLYPSAIGQSNAQEFVFNSESMRFLANNSFNFNQLFYEGVPYMNLKKIRDSETSDKYRKIRQEIASEMALKSPDIASFINLTWGKVKQWIIMPQASSSLEDQINPNTPTYKNLIIDIKHIRVKAYNKLIQIIKSENPSLILNISYYDKNLNILESSNASDIIKRAYLRIERTQSPPQQEKQQGKEYSVPLINSVIQQISHNKIPLIVHNGYLDLMHIYHRFINQLPIQETNFRSKVHEIFPTIFDTKYICNSNPIIFNKLNRDSSLGNCYKLLRETEKSQTEESTSSMMGEFSGEYSFDSEAHHEAGFDAFMTGYTFVNAMKMLHKPIQKIIDPQFRNTDRFYVNKIPQGNIRVPFVFDSKNQDNIGTSYNQDGTTPFHFSLLPSFQKSGAQKPIITSESLDKIESKIQNHFSEEYGGSVKFLWSGKKDSFDFILNFLKVEAENKFIASHFNKQSTEYCIYRLKYIGAYLVRKQALE